MVNEGTISWHCDLSDRLDRRWRDQGAAGGSGPIAGTPSRRKGLALYEAGRAQRPDVDLGRCACDDVGQGLADGRAQFEAVTAASVAGAITLNAGLGPHQGMPIRAGNRQIAKPASGVPTAS